MAIDITEMKKVKHMQMYTELKQRQELINKKIKKLEKWATENNVTLEELDADTMKELRDLN